MSCSVTCGNQSAETCDSPGSDDDCDGLIDAEDPDCADYVAEICNDGIDNDGDGHIDEADPWCSSTPCGGGAPPETCTPPWAGPGDPGDTPDDCKDRCPACVANPVDLLTRQAYIGPHEDFRIESPQGGPFDLAFERTWSTSAAAYDQQDDLLGTTTQKPYPRVLGPGWRHNWDIRLVLEDSPAGGDPESVRLDRPGGTDRFLFVSTGRFGHVPGRSFLDYQVERTATFEGTERIWQFTDEDGTVFEFLEPASGTGSALHPLNATGPQTGIAEKHLRLRTIKPWNVTGARIRVWHEEDSASAPSGSCTSVTTVAPTGCTASRGLLVAASVEWLDASTWRRGASLHFKYSTFTTTKTQYILDKILEGADVDTAVSPPTILSSYTTTADGASGTAWRRLLTGSYSCVGRTSGTTDISGNACTTDAGSQRFAYTPDVVDRHMISLVEQQRATETGTLFPAAVEAFTWALDDDDDPVPSVGRRVDEHYSPGYALIAQTSGLDPRNGTTNWVQNGVQLAFDWRDRRMTRSSRGATVLRQFEHEPVPEDGTFFSGSKRVVTAAEDEVTLRIFNADGTTQYEAVVIPPSGVSASSIVMSTTADGASCTAVSFTNSPTVKRVTRNYYSSGTGGESRLRARVSVTSVTIQPSSPAGKRNFPNNPLASWVPAAGTEASRLVPVHTAVCGSATMYWDAESYDHDGASGGNLNETADAMPVWTHHVQTVPGGSADYSSSRMNRDSSGRVTQIRRFHQQGASLTTAAAGLVARTDQTYISVSSSTSPKFRGRGQNVTAFSSAGTGAGAITTFSACPVANVPYGVLGAPECWDVPQTSGTTQRIVRQTSSNGSFRRVLTTPTVGPQMYEDRLMSGVVYETGIVGGNWNRTSWVNSTDPLDATHESLAKASLTVDSGGTGLRHETMVYDDFGRIERRETRATSGGAILRQNVTQYASWSETPLVIGTDDGVSPGPFASTDYTLNPATGEVLQIAEPDSDLVVNTYGTTGSARGLLTGVSRDGVSVQTLTYDGDGRLATVTNGTELAATYSYREDGKLKQEDLNGTGTGTLLVNRLYSDELYSVSSVLRELARTKTRTGTTVRRDVGTYVDSLGRPIRLCDMSLGTACTAPIVEWTYDAKKTGFTGTKTVEGTSRSVTLTNDNQTGRLSMVQHPAGVTLFEYDAAGRVTFLVQYEVPGATTIGTDTLEKLKVTEYTYGSYGELTGIRYPSGRRVSYLYGTDKEHPTEVYIRTSPDGISTFHRIASNLQYDIDGQPISWTWGQTVGAGHSVIKNGLGRITEIRDFNSSGDRAKVAYSSYDADGDLLAVTDYGPASTILDGATAVPKTHTFGYDAARDVLTSWTEAGSSHSLGLVSATAKRTTETFGAAYGYTFTNERVLQRQSGVGAQPLDLGVAYVTTNLGEVQSLNIGNDGGTPEIASMTYGIRGDLTSYTVSGTGTVTQRRDHAMQRWVEDSTIDVFFRYGLGGEVLDRHRRYGTSNEGRDEYIYVQGVAIGVTHTDDTFPTPVSWWLSPDRLGTPRRVIQRDTNMTQISRLVIDPWGGGTQLDERPPSPTYALPELPFRLPGQVRNQYSTHLVENRWRTYVPGLGQYTAPDPAHRISAAIPGPQTYAFANGRPLLISDTNGLYGRYYSADEAANAAAFYILRQNRSDPVEHCAMIYQDVENCRNDNGKCFDHTGIHAGERTWCELFQAPPGRKAVAQAHNHPMNDPRPSDFVNGERGKNDVQQAARIPVDYIYVATRLKPDGSQGDSLYKWRVGSSVEPASFVSWTSVSHP